MWSELDLAVWEAHIDRQVRVTNQTILGRNCEIWLGVRFNEEEKEPWTVSLKEDTHKRTEVL